MSLKLDIFFKYNIFASIEAEDVFKCKNKKQTFLICYAVFLMKKSISRLVAFICDFEFEAHLALGLGIYLCSLSLTSLSYDQERIVLLT